MRGKFLSAILACLMVAALSTGAWAKPSVVLKLAGVIVVTDAKGAEQTTPLADAQVKPGDIIRYTLTAMNKGDEPALKLTPAAKIPSGTVYEANSASQAGAARVEYSLNNGKTWALKPMVTVHTPTGDVLKPAEPKQYTNLHWIAAAPLAPNAAITYSYEVRVQ